MTDINRIVHLATANNEPRSKPLLDALRKKAEIVLDCEYDPFSSFFKYLAAFLSYSTNRGDWWNKYQWHPIVRFARRRKLLSRLLPIRDKCDALLMWGSWFNPVIEEAGGGLPFWMYIDQSCSPVIDEGDVCGYKSMKARLAFNIYQNRAYHDAHGIFCMSNWAREQTLAAHKLPAGKVHYAGWGPCSIDLSSEEIPLNTKDPIVLFVGHNFYRKGVDILAAACHTLSQKVQNVKVYIVGKKNDNYEIPSHPNLIFTGPLKDKEELLQLFRRATVFCLPARFDRSPHVLVEAMSAGKPIVATDVGGIRDAVVHSETGFLVERGNKDDLTRMLLQVLENPQLAREMGHAGKKRMLQNFTWDVVSEKILSTIMTEQRLRRV